MNIGDVLLGKYRVDEILGHGGMGVVAKCMHLQLNELVAIKMLRRDVLDDRDAVERFMREAQAAVKLRSEYVARVSDVGVFENGVPYMVMEFLDGHDLGELIDERGSLPSPWATEMMLQVAEALAEAHSIGIVHRDVKPTNLFVTWRPDGSALVKVLDFGISKAPIGADMKLTQTQSLLGTPAYMSPEQMRSARMVDSRSDVWSLGTVMYELLEGRRPFEAESFSEMCVKVAVDAPAPMVNAPPALQEVVLRCLAKSPEQRFASMAELGAALRPFAPDPHAAGILVERMQRMLGRRSHVEWDVGAAAAALEAATEAVALAASNPHLSAGLGVSGSHLAAVNLAASNPQLAPISPISQISPVPPLVPTPAPAPHLPAALPPSASAGAAAAVGAGPASRREGGDLHEITLRQPRKQRAGLLVLGGAALLGVAIGLVATYGRGGATEDAPAAPVEVAPSAEPVPAVPPAEVKLAAPAPPVEIAPVEVAPVKRPATITVRKRKPEDKIEAPQVPEPQAAPKAPCKPYDDPHGCPKT